MRLLALITLLLPNIYYTRSIGYIKYRYSKYRDTIDTADTTDTADTPDTADTHYNLCINE